MGGQRINTREQRKRKKIEDKLQSAIQDLQQLFPNYQPPPDCAQVAKYTAKVFIPNEKYPHINFVGLCIGPRGMTLKEMEEETGAKIIIRGKGSVKEGKIGADQIMLPGADEPLHAYITGAHHDAISKAKDRINKIVKEAIDSPDSENSLRSKQMNQLALIHGTTIKSTDMLGKMKQNVEASKVFTNNLVCTICGGSGHLPQDCKYKGDAANLANIKLDQTSVNSEYMSLMNELNQQSGNSNNNLPSIQSQVTGANKEVAFLDWKSLFGFNDAQAAQIIKPPTQQPNALQQNNNPYAQNFGAMFMAPQMASQLNFPFNPNQMQALQNQNLLPYNMNAPMQNFPATSQQNHNNIYSQK